MPNFKQLNARTSLAFAFTLALVTVAACGGRRASVAPDAAPREGAQREVARVEEMLEGKAGVILRRAGNDFSVRIRGVGSFMSSDEPLWVIDGMPVHVGPGNGLTWLNPKDVASIQVLKNPEDLAIYGVRGANGVIVVKTKKPGRQDD